MINALLAGTIVAVSASVVGWLTLLRREAFAAHTLSMMAFPGAALAALAGIPAAWGYLAACTTGSLAIAGSSRRSSWTEQSAEIGAVQALALAAGFLFLSLYGGVLGDLESLLFGNILGVSDGEVLLLAVLAGLVLATLALLWRPLLFASLAPDAARARGLRVGRLAAAFLLLLGVAVAATSLLTGVLLVFALLVGPPATAQALSARPAVSLALSVLLALATAWLGLAVAYFSVYPAGFFIATISFALYLAARVAAALRSRRTSAPAPVAQPAGA
jgi:zinc/manganese transport system permease protein